MMDPPFHSLAHLFLEGGFWTHDVDSESRLKVPEMLRMEEMTHRERDFLVG